MTTIIGIDFGVKHIGVAVSDPDRKIAFPLGTFDVDSLDEGVKNIAKLCVERNAKQLVIGLPKNLENTETSLTKKVQFFAKKIELLWSGEIFFFDERWSTKQAEKMIKNKRNKRKNKKGIDEISAQIILQNYLDSF
ncbi:Holliday junction resolvase RuvX [Candidatus Peregrinibacteria bacterium]|nr:Holliday junction resolvase RuvX [Candidatus Peregrinibacteria bacterium]